MQHVQTVTKAQKWPTESLSTAAPRLSRRLTIQVPVILSAATWGLPIQARELSYIKELGLLDIRADYDRYAKGAASVYLAQVCSLQS